MAGKKQVKKRVKKTMRETKKKAIKKPRAKTIKKPIQQEVIKRLEQEVRKPGLGERKGVRDREFIPEKKFVKRFERRDKFIKPRFEKKRFPDKRRFEKQDFKSHGEKEISRFLKEEKIHFLYEYPLAITDEDRKVRIWYPDFLLPELNVIIEYMGMKGKGDYDRANIRKKKIYNALKIDFIEITPGLIVKGNWKRFIAMKIIDIMKSKRGMYNKMKSLSQKYRIAVEERAKENVGLEILD